MNSIKKLSAFAILFLTFGLTSCSDVEPLDPAVIVNPTNPSNPSNPTNPGTSTGDYFPTALNNSWTYKQGGVIQPIMKIVSINSIGANTYYTFNEAFGTTNGVAMRYIQENNLLSPLKFFRCLNTLTKVFCNTSCASS